MQRRLKALFLDREGILTPKLNKGEYLLHHDQALLNQEVPQAFAGLDMVRTSLFVVSNQSCVARGLIGLDQAYALHSLLIEKLASVGVLVKDSRLCPHVDQDECGCRKPKPGMLLDLAAEYGLNLSETAMIGDSESDIKAGVAAGCSVSILVNPDLPPVGTGSWLVVGSLLQATEALNRYFIL